MDIDLPYKFKPRPYQVAMMKALDSGVKRVFCIHHRRAGKDITLWNMLIKKAVEKVGIYYYLLPTYVQAKRIIWDGITNDGFKFVDYIPDGLIRAKNGTELKIELINGSIVQLIGTDNYDAIRGTNPIGCVFSEFAFQNPMAWEVVKPILRVNGGWAVFNTTPNGKNHAYDMFNMAQEDNEWFCEKLSINDTKVLGEEDMDRERKEGMSTEMIEQEYYCLDPNTRLLTASLEWIPIKDVREGQDLIGVDEHARSTTKRKFRRSKVLKKWHTEKECRRIKFTDGTEIIASYEHPFLEKAKPIKNKRNTYEWVETRDLTIGMKIADVGLRPWEVGLDREDGYMAGLYDGEGCLSRTTTQVAQREGIVLDTAREYFNQKNIKTFETKQSDVITISTSLQSSMHVLGVVRPKRLMEKAAAIWEDRFPFNGQQPLEIASIENVGTKPVVGISTSTKTFIAEGLITHNCSFDVGTLGSYYAALIKEARDDNRICALPVDNRIMVELALDLGRNDSTSIIFFQKIGKEIRIIDFYESNGKDVGHYCKYLDKMKYDYGDMWLPHDAFNERLESPKTIADQFREAGFNVKRVQKAKTENGIQEVRKIFPQLWFDVNRTQQLIRAVENYHKEWDEKYKVFRNTPRHDWSSHACDALRYMAIALKEDKKDTVSEYKEGAAEYLQEKGIINPLTHQEEKDKSINQYTGQAESYINI